MNPHGNIGIPFNSNSSDAYAQTIWSHVAETIMKNFNVFSASDQEDIGRVMNASKSIIAEVPDIFRARTLGAAAKFEQARKLIERSNSKGIPLTAAEVRQINDVAKDLFGVFCVPNQEPSQGSDPVKIRLSGNQDVAFERLSDNRMSLLHAQYSNLNIAFDEAASPEYALLLWQAVANAVYDAMNAFAEEDQAKIAIAIANGVELASSSTNSLRGAMLRYESGWEQARLLLLKRGTPDATSKELHAMIEVFVSTTK